MWAHSVFWSRALALPVPVREPAADGARSRGNGSNSSGSGVERLRIEVLEGLVPGLDFANHSQQARCWWEVAEQLQQQQPAAAAGDDSSNSSSSSSDGEPGAAPVVAAGQHSSYIVRLLTNRVRGAIGYSSSSVACSICRPHARALH